MHYHISQAKQRVVIFEPFEDINTTAANALLKTLEELTSKHYILMSICTSVVDNNQIAISKSSLCPSNIGTGKKYRTAKY